MINKYVAMGLGALIALAPVAASAQATTDTTAPAASMASPAKGHMGSHRGHATPQGPHGRAPGARFGSSRAQEDDGPRRGPQELIGRNRA